MLDRKYEYSYEKMMREIETYIHKEDDLNLIKEAYEYALKKHTGQFRKSGEPYIIHPIAVTTILAGLNCGPNTLCAGLLHDVVEDTETSLDDIKTLFNEDIAEMVDGVTKVTKLQFSSLKAQQVTNHQKMLLAMASDIRVIIIKLADRLHNMRTLDSIPPEKQVRIANETLEIYAPLASRLGMFKLKAELEDRSLRYIDPQMYFKIVNLVKERQDKRNNIIETVVSEVKNLLLESHLKFQIKGRIKNTYSIYKKMVSQNKAFEDIYDVYAIRIIVGSVAECYQVLGLIHAHYTPMQKRFKDYIAVPKSNMYQSLHTTVIGPSGQTFEVQIRTEEMDKIAEYGIAAHWAYKENVQYSKEREQYEIAKKLKWYADLLEVSGEVSKEDASELVDSVKSDILDTNVYVYTPTGEVIDLPKGATPLDFAYKIHTNLGNKTVGAIVNNKIVPLTYELKTADIVSIKTNKNSFGPSESWLNIVKTNHAKHKIKTFLNKQNRDVIVSVGKSELENEMQTQKIVFDLNDKWVKENFNKNNIFTVDDIYYEIGKNSLSAKTVCLKIQGTNFSSEDMLQKQMEKTRKILTTNSETGVVVDGLPNPQIKLGSCCYPIPGDEIIGYITKGNGIVVHRCECNNLKNLGLERTIHLDWASNISRKYPTCIRVSAMQKDTLIGDLMTCINSLGLSIASINAVNTPDLQTIVKLKVLTSNLNELNNLIVNMKKIEAVHNIERDNQ